MFVRVSWRSKAREGISSGVHLHAVDALIALHLAAHPHAWSETSVAEALGLSVEAVQNSLQRLAASRLFHQSERRVRRADLLRFLLNGLPYVFPAEVGKELVEGLPTAHSAAPLVSRVVADVPVVWPVDGGVRGYRVSPLHPSAPSAASHDPVLYEYLALVDALRLGRARERTLAQQALTARLG